MLPDTTPERELVELWIANKRSRHTKRAYRKEIEAFYRTIDKPLSQVTLADAITYAQAITGGENTKRRTINILKSFYSFACKTNLFQVNVFAAVVAPGPKSAVSERILPEWAVQRMIALETNPRNHCLLMLLYASGVRVSELCNLQWGQVIERSDGGQIDVVGKGDKKRSILLHTHAWAVLLSLRGSCGPHDYVFQSRQSVSRTGGSDGKRLDTRSVLQIVRKAAIRASVPDPETAKKVSPHWLRHSHGSHSIEHNAPITVVRDTMGHSSIAVTNTYAHARPGTSSSTYLPI